MGHRPNLSRSDYGRAERPGKAVGFNVTLDEGLVAAIDRVTSNRSGFLAEAAREYLARRKEQRLLSLD